MNQDKPSDAPKARSAPAPKPGKGPPTPPVAPVRPPLFRRIDWLCFGLTSLLIFIGYMITLAPNLTLEDSGELATGSYYAGVPHPPGYPVWTLYTWFFTQIIPFGNVAYRVGISSAFAGATACGLLGLLVSRGSSMMLEGIETLKTIERRWESALCVVSGFVAGMIMGFNGYMWSQAIIVEVYTLSVLSLMGVLCCLLRWMYAPEARRYLYFAMLLFGICITNHMSLLLAAMGIEVAITAAQPKLGRDLFAGNVIVYIITLCMKLSAFDSNPLLFAFFNAIGIGSILACGYFTLKTEKLGTEWKSAFIMLLMWVLGAGFYLYMPIASMSNPPMNWGYPRTAEGFMHALKRGQYESVHPTSGVFRFFDQMLHYGDGAQEEFGLLFLLIAIIPFIFFKRMQKRERAWLIGLTGIYICLSLLLLFLLNPGSDKQSRDLNKVFFTASHVMIAMSMGYGLSILGALLLTHYQAFRKWFLYGAAAAVGVAMFSLFRIVDQTFSDRVSFGGLRLFSHGLKAAISGGQNQLDVLPFLIVVALAGAFFLVILFCRSRIRFVPVLVIFTLMPSFSIVSHWFNNEQRGHLFGYWFGHDMFTPPFQLYPEMTRDAILFGGTDPGRFCPTYMIFCESFIPARCKADTDPKFDRRDVYIITQNALADGTYLSYIRAHYNRSTQIDPPFFQSFFHTPLLSPLDSIFTSIGAKIEAARRARGVYPKKEILTPSPDDSQTAFNTYLADAERRYKIGQLKPGEDFHVEAGRVQVSGQVAVMQINALLTKNIFDRNPNNEFFVEESFPLDWMFPHLTPFGIIMKINRTPVPEITQEMVDKDHKFWAQFSARTIGNWINYDTPVSNICAFAERTYLHHDFNGFQGDRKFVRDDDAQKAFSKLRSSIGGVYAWRLGMMQGIATPPEFLARDPFNQQRMLREAEFTFKQAFAFCPYSPEAVYRYMNLLLALNRIDDAIMVVETCHKLDTLNTSISNLLDQLKEARKHGNFSADVRTTLNDAMRLVRERKTNEAMEKLDSVLSNPGANDQAMLVIATNYISLGAVHRLEPTLQRLVQLNPDSAEGWYDLAALEASYSKPDAAIEALSRALKINGARLVREPNANNLTNVVRQDGRFNAIRQTPEFLKLMPQ